MEIDRLLHWVVIGAGPTGVELVAELSDFLKICINISLYEYIHTYTDEYVYVFIYVYTYSVYIYIYMHTQV
jgi:hypothetical protein